MDWAAIEWTISPIVFEVGPVTIRWYGLCFLAAILLSIKIMEKPFERLGRDPDDAASLTVYVVVGIIIGSRLMHCLAYDPSQYLSNPFRILKIWEGGLSSHGAAIGALLGGWVWVSGAFYRLCMALAPFTPSFVKKGLILFFGEVRHQPGLTWFKAADITIPGFGISIIFVRLGNLFNHEIVGRQTDLPWAFTFTRYPLDKTPVPRHPSQIYELLLGLAILIVTYYLSRKRFRKHRDGFLLFVFGVMYFFFRFFLEYFKDYQSELTEHNGALTMGQWLSVPFFLLSVPFFIAFFKRPQHQIANDVLEDQAIAEAKERAAKGEDTPAGKDEKSGGGKGKKKGKKKNKK